MGTKFDGGGMMSRFRAFALACVFSGLASCGDSKQGALEDIQTIDLTARKDYRPSRWTDGTHIFSRDLPFRIPSKLDVTAGNSGNHKSYLFFKKEGEKKESRCEYKGGSSQSHPKGQKELDKAKAYLLVKCDGGLKAGHLAVAKELRLRLDNGGNEAGHTAIRVLIEAAAEPDLPPDDVLDALANLPTAQVDWQRVVYDDGSILNAPQGVMLGLQASGTMDVRRDFVSALAAEGERLMTRSNFQFPDEGVGKPAQDGLAYSFGSKDERVRQKPPAGVCGRSQGSLNYEVHGLDCSGMVARMAQAAGLSSFIGGPANAQRQPEPWNAAIAGSAFRGKLRAVFLNSAADPKSGDIVGWQGHIGVVNSDGASAWVSQSNGIPSPRSDRLCSYNYGSNAGPRALRLSGMLQVPNRGWGPSATRLRIMPIPVLSSLDKPFGRLSGGNTITLNGDGFYTDVEVRFGSVLVPSANVRRLAFNRLEVKVPAGTVLGKVPVLVSNVVKNSLESTVAAEKTVDYEYRNATTRIDDISPQQNDSGALDDLSNDENNQNPEAVEPGKSLYIEGSGLNGAQFVVPGVTARLSANRVSVPSGHPLEAPGSEVWRLTIPASAQVGASGLIRAIIAVDGVDQSFESPRSVQVQEPQAAALYTRFVQGASGLPRNADGSVVTVGSCPRMTPGFGFQESQVYHTYWVEILEIRSGPDAGSTYKIRTLIDCNFGGGASMSVLNIGVPRRENPGLGQATIKLSYSYDDGLSDYWVESGNITYREYTPRLDAGGNCDVRSFTSRVYATFAAGSDPVIRPGWDGTVTELSPSQSSCSDALIMGMKRPENLVMN